jgi:hypothetical protein
MLTLSAAACTMLGCSDPVPAAAAAGLTINIGICPAQTQQATLGNPAPDRTRPIDPLGKPVYSGQAGTSVDCKVTADGNIFGNVQSSPNSIGFRVQGQIDPADGKGTATIGLRAAGISEYVSQPADAVDSPCTIDVVKTSAGSQFKAGAVWAVFTCTNMKHKASFTLCSAQGEFAFQRCDN